MSESQKPVRGKLHVESGESPLFDNYLTLSNASFDHIRSLKINKNCDYDFTSPNRQQPQR